LCEKRLLRRYLTFIRQHWKLVAESARLRESMPHIHNFYGKFELRVCVHQY
jgi:hypothetical protein